MYNYISIGNFYITEEEKKDKSHKSFIDSYEISSTVNDVEAELQQLKSYPEFKDISTEELRQYIWVQHLKDYFTSQKHLSYDPDVGLHTAYNFKELAHELNSQMNTQYSEKEVQGMFKNARKKLRTIRMHMEPSYVRGVPDEYSDRFQADLEQYQKERERAESILQDAKESYQELDLNDVIKKILSRDHQKVHISPEDNKRFADESFLKWANTELPTKIRKIINHIAINAMRCTMNDGIVGIKEKNPKVKKEVIKFLYERRGRWLYDLFVDRSGLSSTNNDEQKIKDAIYFTIMQKISLPWEIAYSGNTKFTEVSAFKVMACLFPPDKKEVFVDRCMKLYEYLLTNVFGKTIDLARYKYFESIAVKNVYENILNLQELYNDQKIADISKESPTSIPTLDLDGIAQSLKQWIETPGKEISIRGEWVKNQEELRARAVDLLSQEELTDEETSELEQLMDRIPQQLPVKSKDGIEYMPLDLSNVKAAIGQLSMPVEQNELDNLLNAKDIWTMREIAQYPIEHFGLKVQKFTNLQQEAQNKLKAIQDPVKQLATHVVKKLCEQDINFTSTIIGKTYDLGTVMIGNAIYALKAKFGDFDKITIEFHKKEEGQSFSGLTNEELRFLIDGHDLISEMARLHLRSREMGYLIIEDETGETQFRKFNYNTVIVHHGVEYDTIRNMSDRIIDYFRKLEGNERYLDNVKNIVGTEVDGVLTGSINTPLKRSESIVSLVEMYNMTNWAGAMIYALKNKRLSKNVMDVANKYYKQLNIIKGIYPGASAIYDDDTPRSELIEELNKARTELKDIDIKMLDMNKDSKEYKKLSADRTETYKKVLARKYKLAYRKLRKLFDDYVRRGATPEEQQPTAKSIRSEKPPKGISGIIVVSIPISEFNPNVDDGTKILASKNINKKIQNLIGSHNAYLLSFEEEARKAFERIKEEKHNPKLVVKWENACDEFLENIRKTSYVRRRDDWANWDTPLFAASPGKFLDRDLITHKISAKDREFIKAVFTRAKISGYSNYPEVLKDLYEYFKIKTAYTQELGGSSIHDEPLSKDSEAIMKSGNAVFNGPRLMSRLVRAAEEMGQAKGAEQFSFMERAYRDLATDVVQKVINTKKKIEKRIGPEEIKINGEPYDVVYNIGGSAVQILSIARRPGVWTKILLEKYDKLFWNSYERELRRSDSALTLEKFKQIHYTTPIENAVFAGKNKDQKYREIWGHKIDYDMQNGGELQIAIPGGSDVLPTKEDSAQRIKEKRQIIQDLVLKQLKNVKIGGAIDVVKDQHEFISKGLIEQPIRPGDRITVDNTHISTIEYTNSRTGLVHLKDAFQQMQPGMSFVIDRLDAEGRPTPLVALNVAGFKSYKRFGTDYQASYQRSREQKIDLGLCDDDFIGNVVKKYRKTGLLQIRNKWNAYLRKVKGRYDQRQWDTERKELIKKRRQDFISNMTRVIVGSVHKIVPPNGFISADLIDKIVYTGSKIVFGNGKDTIVLTFNSNVGKIRIPPDIKLGLDVKVKDDFRITYMNAKEANNLFDMLVQLGDPAIITFEEDGEYMPRKNWYTIVKNVLEEYLNNRDISPKILASTEVGGDSIHKLLRTLIEIIKKKKTERSAETGIATDTEFDEKDIIELYKNNREEFWRRAIAILYVGGKITSLSIDALFSWLDENCPGKHIKDDATLALTGSSQIRDDEGYLETSEIAVPNRDVVVEKLRSKLDIEEGEDEQDEDVKRKHEYYVDLVNKIDNCWDREKQQWKLDMEDEIQEIYENEILTRDISEGISQERMYEVIYENTTMPIILEAIRCIREEDIFRLRKIYKTVVGDLLGV